MTDPRAATLEVRVEGDSGADADRIDRETRQLRSELSELGLGPVDIKRGESPPGAKTGDGLFLGSLLMEVVPNAISPLIDFLKSWTLRHHGRTVKIKTVLADRSAEIEFDPATVSPAEVNDLVSSVIKRLDRKKG